MIINKVKSRIVALTFAVLLCACDDFGDINVSPNATTVPLTSALLTNGLSGLGGSTTGGANLLAGLYCQYFSLTQYTDNSLYSAADIDWTGVMAGSLYDFENIIKINTDPKTATNAALQGSNNNQIAIARIMKAYWFSVLTDRYGDMPYFQALKGETQPQFDTQEAIYTDLFKELKEAVQQFDNGATVRGDILYNGNNLRWKRFANSLRIILALRISEVNPTKAEQEVEDALASDGGVFQSNEDNAILIFPGGNFRNPWFALGADQAVSELVASLLNKDLDNRRAAFGKPQANGLLKGFPYGLTRDEAVSWNNANPGWSLILNDGFRAENSGLPILTYADVLLARAQAAEYGWTNEDFNQLYILGLQASWSQWNVFNEEEFNAFMEDTDIALTPTTAAEKIALQRWLTFFPNGMQGWSEWRRTGIPALTPTPNAVNPSKEIPVRFQYPSVEYNYNNENVMIAVQRLGGTDTDIDRVWWDN